MEYQNWEIVSSGTRGVSLRDKGFGGFAGLTKLAHVVIVAHPGWKWWWQGLQTCSDLP